MTRSRKYDRRFGVVRRSGGSGAPAPTATLTSPTVETFLYPGVETTLTASVTDATSAVFKLDGVEIGTATITGNVASLAWTPTRAQATLAGSLTCEATGPGGTTASAAVSVRVYWYTQEAAIAAGAVFDGLDSSTFALSGDNVLTWDDVSGNARHLSAAGTGNLVRTKSINSRTAIGALADGPRLENTSAFTWIEAHAVAVYGSATFATYDGLVAAPSDTIAADSNIGLAGNQGFGTWYPQPGHTFYLNGTASSTAPMTVAGVAGVHRSSTSVQGMSVGQDRRQTSRTWNGAIGDVVFANAALAADARARVVNCAKARWGIT